VFNRCCFNFIPRFRILFLKKYQKNQLEQAGVIVTFFWKDPKESNQRKGLRSSAAAASFSLIKSIPSRARMQHPADSPCARRPASLLFALSKLYEIYAG